MKTIQEQLRQIPAVHRIIEDPAMLDLLKRENWSRDYLVEEIGIVLNSIRSNISQGLVQINNQAELTKRIISQIEKRNKKI